jgi:hypothetical protein
MKFSPLWDEIFPAKKYIKDIKISIVNSTSNITKVPLYSELNNTPCNPRPTV